MPLGCSGLLKPVFIWIANHAGFHSRGSAKGHNFEMLRGNYKTTPVPETWDQIEGNFFPSSSANPDLHINLVPLGFFKAIRISPCSGFRAPTEDWSALNPLAFQLSWHIADLQVIGVSGRHINHVVKTSF